MLLRAADAARLSSETQDAFGQAEASRGACEWMDLVEPLVERPVLRAYGLDPDAELARLRYEANSRPELRQHAHWLRHNRARPVPFALGDEVPLYLGDVHEVYTDDDDGTVQWDAYSHSLDTTIPLGQPALIVASSRT